MGKNELEFEYEEYLEMLAGGRDVAMLSWLKYRIERLPKETTLGDLFNRLGQDDVSITALWGILSKVKITDLPKLFGESKGAKRKKTKRSATQIESAIVELLFEKGALSQVAIEESLRLHRGTADKRLEELQSQSRITIEGEGKNRICRVDDRQTKMDNI